MLKAGQIEWILRLDREGLSQRAIHRATGMAQGTISSVLEGNRPDPPLRDTLYDVDNPVFTEPPRRCSGCGAMAYMPCLACRLRERM
jgi:transcriptional regulator with XRE-family HTH domain